MIGDGPARIEPQTMTNSPDTMTRAESPSAGRLTWLKEAAAIATVFTIATLIVTWPVAEDPFNYIAGDVADPVLNAWVLGWGAEALRTLQNVWNAPIFFPYENTLAYSEHLIGVAWPLAPVMWVTKSPVFMYNVAFLLSFVLAGSGMYLLTRTLTGRRDAALVLGTGKNYDFLRRLNDEYEFFEKLEVVEHPRFIMQYRRPHVRKYLDKYEAILRPLSRG